jgi:hypothetical protein
MDKALTIFIWAWATLAVVVNVVAVAGFLITADSIWDGLDRVRDTYSPFNLFNFVAEMVLLSPAIGAYIWRERRRSKQGII